MEWIILLAIVIAYSSLSEKIKKLSDQSENTKKKFPSLKDLIGKNIEIETEDFYENGAKRILKFYDDTWIAIESINKNKKTKINYFRISSISAINLFEK